MDRGAAAPEPRARRDPRPFMASFELGARLARGPWRAVVTRARPAPRRERTDGSLRTDGRRDSSVEETPETRERRARGGAARSRECGDDETRNRSRVARFLECCFVFYRKEDTEVKRNEERCTARRAWHRPPRTGAPRWVIESNSPPRRPLIIDRDASHSPLILLAKRKGPAT